ncbi:hypothetical protein V6Z12_A01G092900 [Gossypium hirsutum]
MLALTKIFGDSSILQFDGGTLGHAWGNASGAVANRVALEICVQTRNEGRDLALFEFLEGCPVFNASRRISPNIAMKSIT